MLYGSFDFAIDSSVPTLTKIDGSTFRANRSGLSTGDQDILRFKYGVFARIRVKNPFDINNPSTEGYGGDFYAEFYEDSNLNKPISLPFDITLNFTEWIRDRGSASDRTHRRSKIVKAGSNSVLLAKRFIIDYCVYDFGDVAGPCYDAGIILNDNFGYQLAKK